MLSIKEFQTKDLFKNRSLTLDLEPGYILGVIGPNGSGKSQFLENITLKPLKYQGSIKLNGNPNYRKEMSYIPEKFPYLPHMKIKEISKLISLAQTSFCMDTFNSLLNRYELDRKLKIKKLSLGQKQRLMIAISLASKAKLIVMDEPTEGIDPFSLELIMDDLREYVIVNDANLVIVTHQIKIYEAFFDHILYMEDHEILLNETYPDFITSAKKYMDADIEIVKISDFVAQRQKGAEHARDN